MYSRTCSVSQAVMLSVSMLQDEVVRFPYAILEVKVQQQPPPSWVESMLLLSGASTCNTLVF